MMRVNPITMRYLVYFLLIVFLFVGSIRLYYNLTDDFRIANITYDLPFKTSWATEVLSSSDNAHLDQLLSQKFSYIDKGAQCYAFGSEDGRYVLKFFKFKHLKPNWLMQLLPSSKKKDDYLLNKQKKIKNVFDAYDLAYREDRQNVALIYLHLTPVQDFQKKVLVIDKIGFEREIDLNSTVFLIQKRGVTFRSRLTTLLDNKNVEGTKTAINKILHMYLSEYHQGIYDRDHGVMVNAGFVGEQPFHLDAGKFAKVESIKEKIVYSEDLELVIWKIEEWIQATYPHYKNELFPFLEDTYHQITGLSYERSKINLELFKAKRHSPLLNP